MEKLLVTGVAADKDTVRISVIGLEDKPGTAFAVFNTLAANNINVDIILQSVGREGTKDISFTVASDDLEHAIEVLNANKERLTIQDITWNKKVAKLSIVGAGMMSNPGVAAKMFESLYNSRVNINMISTSEIRITVLVPEEDIEKAISLFPKIMSLFQISDEQKQKIEQDYFNMLVLDSVIGNVDRVMDNYGVVQRKNGKIEFSPLFDNATITIPDIPQQYAKINSYLIDKSRIMDVLYEKYYDKIKPITSQILEHRDEYYKFIKDISQKELNESEQRWFVEDTFNKNLDRICERERKQQLEVMPHQVQPQQFNKPKVKTLTRNSNDNSSGSKGFADAITLSLMVGFMCGILFIIVYILIKR